MKRKLAAVLIASMALGLAACGSSSAGQTSSGKTDTAAIADTEEKEVAVNPDDMYTVSVEIVTLGENPSGLSEVEAAINEIAMREIGCKVELYPVSAMELSTQNTLSLTSGEKMDLIFSFGETANYANKGMIIPLEDLYEKYGAPIDESQGPALAGGYYGGHLYAIPVIEVWGDQKSFLARTDMLDEMGITIDDSKIYTMDELSDIFKQFKEKYGDSYYCLGGLTSTTDNYASYNSVDTLGKSASSGALIGAGLDGNTTIENLYASEEYAAYAELMYDWAQSGYIAPEAATNTDSAQAQIMSGHYLGVFGSGAGDGAAVFAQSCGCDISIIRLCAPYANTSSYSGMGWCVANTSENPEMAFKVLSYLYEKHDLEDDIDTLLTLGIEGKSYQFVERGEGSRGIITFADGVDPTSTPYNMALGIYGDKSSQPKWAPLTLDFYDEVAAFNTSLGEDNISCVTGYVFDTSAVASQLAAVDSVVAQYESIIAAGALNPETTLAEMNSALVAAGIEDVIAENQKQLDAWLAENK